MLALRDLQWIMVIDRPFLEFCREQHFTQVEKLCLVSDVGELSRSTYAGSARDGLALRSEAFVILLYGSVSRLKGVEELLRSVQRLNDPEVIALVAGKPVPEVEALFSEPQYLAMQESGQLVLRAEFQDDVAEAKLFAAADLVWLGYVGGAYGSSGVLYQAGAAGLPVISMADGLIGWTVREHNLGVTVDPTDTAAVVDVIRGLRDEEETMRKFGENGRRLAKRHTGAAFAATICDALAATNRDHA
jgi:glycosyltransferase involved in cell wall biosynthesis